MTTPINPIAGRAPRATPAHDPDLASRRLAKRARVTTKPFPGHKRGGVERGFAVRCECGWRSETSYGKGGMASANAEWRWHVDQHRKVAAGELPCACGGTKRHDGMFIHNSMSGCRRPPEATS